MKVEATEIDGRKVYSVRAFNQGIGSWLGRLPSVWVDGEITELRRQERWQSVFFTLKDPESGAGIGVQMQRGLFDALELDLANGERVQVFGRAELYEQRGELRLRALTIERVGLGAHLAALERLKQKLAGEGLFDESRKRPLPRFPRLIGLVTGSDAAAKRDVLTGITSRFPPANVVVAETFVQGPRAPAAIAAALIDAVPARRRRDRARPRRRQLRRSAAVLRRARRARRRRAARVPVVSAVGHEQDTPLCDLAADVRASTPTAAARLVVPDIAELRHRLESARAALHLRRPAHRRAPRRAA